MNRTPVQVALARTLTKMIFSAALAASFATAQAGRPYPTSSTPAPQEVGAITLARGAQPISATVVLKWRDASALEALVQALHTPGSPQFHQFLTPEQFHARFDPS